MNKGFKVLFRYGDFVIFICKVNFIMKGSKIVWCQVNEMWGLIVLLVCESGKQEIKISQSFGVCQL